VSDALILTSVRTGRQLDRVTLVNGQLAYETGKARGIFDGLRTTRPDLTDEQLLALRADWSNGYIALTPTNGAEADSDNRDGTAS
jgi:hypothetical protein